jgi:acetyl-CoA acetyltransferase
VIAGLRRAAIVGVGYTEFVAAAESSVLELAREASAAAVVDAGLRAKDVDGIASFMVMHDSVPTQAVATALAVEELRFSLDLDLGGQAPCHLVAQAAAAIATGQAEVVVVYRAMKGRSGSRVGAMEFAGGGGQYRYPIGYSAYLMYVAMFARRFLHETGQGAEDLAAVAMAQRRYALDNPRAFRRRPLSAEDYAASPMVVDPFRAADCTIEVDGACAVVVTSLERARDLRHPPAVVAAGGYRAGPRSGLDIGDHLRWRDYSRNYTSWLAGDLYKQAGLSASDVQFAEIYDCFSSTVLMGLEGLGLCGRGESGAFVASGATARDGALPTNTHGGLLAEGYLHGMNTVNEAVLQVQGRGGDRQVPHNEVCAVTSGAMMDGSGLILTVDR